MHLPTVPPAVTGHSSHRHDLAERRRTCLRALTGLLASTVLFQRLVVPLGGTELSVVFILTYSTMAYLAGSGAIVVDRLNALLYLLATSACVLAVVTNFGTGKTTSLVYLVLIYLPFCLRLRGELRSIFAPLVDRFIALMTVLGVVGVLQMALQLAGLWTYQDLVAVVVPVHYLARGYNTAYPIAYGSPLIKSTSFVFYEPSFFSQFVALALIMTLLRKGATWRVLVFVVALACAVSGTGILLLGVGLVCLALRRGPTWTLRLAALAALAGAVVSVSPLGSAFLARRGEASSQDSSASLRFVQPYQYTWQVLSHARPAAVGLGPGAADATAARIGVATGRPIAFASSLKLLLEYGLPGGLAFLAFLLVALTRGTPSWVLTGCVLALHLVLSGGLLQAPTAFAAMVLTTTFAKSSSVLVGGLYVRLTQRRSATGRPKPRQHLAA